MGEEKGVDSGGGEIKERRVREILACEKGMRHSPKKLRRNLLATPAISRQGTNVRRAKQFRIASDSLSHPSLLLTS